MKDYTYQELGTWLTEKAEIRESAFRECTSLTSINLPQGLYEIDYYAFLDCSNLRSVLIPDSVKRIGYRAFWGLYDNQTRPGGAGTQWQGTAAKVTVIYSENTLYD